MISRSQNLPTEQQELIAQQVVAFSANFAAPFADGGGPAFIVTVLGGLGWIVAVVAAAVALKGARAPLGGTILIGLSAVFVVHDAPTAPVAMLCLLAGTVWVELQTKRVMTKSHST
ncbi:hypothetical protein ACDX78_07025 [Virgibacillus oceani]